MEVVGVIFVPEVGVSSTSVNTIAGRLRFCTGVEKGAIGIRVATEAELIASMGDAISEGREDLSEDPRGIFGVRLSSPQPKQSALFSFSFNIYCCICSWRPEYCVVAEGRAVSTIHVHCS